MKLDKERKLNIHIYWPFYLQQIKAPQFIRIRSLCFIWKTPDYLNSNIGIDFKICGNNYFVNAKCYFKPEQHTQV